MENAISQRDSNDGGNPDAIPFCLFDIVHKIYRQANDIRAPAIKTENLIGEIDDLPAFDIRKFRTSSWTRALRDVFRTELSVGA